MEWYDGDWISGWKIKIKNFEYKNYNLTVVVFFLDFENKKYISIYIDMFYSINWIYEMCGWLIMWFVLSYAKYFSGKKITNYMYAFQDREYVCMWDYRQTRNKAKLGFSSSQGFERFVISQNQERVKKYSLHDIQKKFW